MTLSRNIGAWHGVQLDVVAWDGVAADVDLSFACMFTRERDRTGPAGGLLHLDQALSGRLVALRERGIFRGRMLETLHIDRPGPKVVARAVMVIGLGDPSAWTPDVSAQAASTAARLAAYQKAGSAAFAPSVLDGGVTPSESFARPMMRAVLEVIAAQAQIAEEGLASAVPLTRWVFDVGAPRFESAAEEFQAELEAMQRSGPS